jgi:hypothetical protein
MIPVLAVVSEESLLRGVKLKGNGKKGERFESEEHVGIEQQTKGKQVVATKP